MRRRFSGRWTIGGLMAMVAATALLLSLIRSFPERPSPGRLGQAERFRHFADIDNKIIIRPSVRTGIPAGVRPEITSGLPK